jgi:16S rRNA (cytosine967-C5)-methyltransferase
MKPTARSVALDALMRGGDAAEHLDNELRAVELDPRDRAFATELAYGTLKMQRALVWAVERYLNRPFAQIEPRLRWILLLGAYQLLYLDRVPVHSAVDESVDLAKAHGHKGTAGLANAVLRKIASEPVRPPRPTSSSGAEALGLYASMPDWIAAHLIARLGFDAALLTAEGLNGAPRRALRVDLARQAASSLAAELDAAGAQTHGGSYGIPECLVVEAGGANQAVHDAIAARKAAWQSEESQLAVHLLAPLPGETILDMCAGRGVKTLMIARRLAGRGAVWSLDDDESKLSFLRNATTAAGLDIVREIRGDAREPLPAVVPESVDAALIDAPCSGLGVIGRRPDSRWRKRESDPQRFGGLAARILRQTAERVRPGGRLLYVTCSTSPLEDENVVDAFLAESPQWKATAVALSGTGARSIGNYSMTVPGIDGADGFFYAMLRRSQ